MILRAHFAVLLCLLMGLMADAFYLKFKPPRSKAAVVKDIKSEAGKLRYPKHIDHITQWLRNKRRKQLVVLDRKDKRVQEFLQQLIFLIEQSQLPMATKLKEQKKSCHKTFGSIHDARNERVLCERYASGEHSQVKPEIKLVIPMLRYVRAILLGEKRDSDVDTSEESRSLRRRGSSSESSDKETNDDVGRKRKRPTRFAVIENHIRQKHLRKKKQPVESDSDYSDDSKHDEDNNDDDDSKDDKDNNDDVDSKDSDNDEDKSSKEDDSDDSKTDSDNENKEAKTNSDDEKKGEKKPKKERVVQRQRKRDSALDHYVSMQGSRTYDNDRRFNRNPNHFMPKRYDWDSSEINHLGLYWFEGPQGRNPKESF